MAESRKAVQAPRGAGRGAEIAGVLVAIVTTLIVAAIRYALGGVLGESSPLLLFTIAVMAAAVVGGWKAGCLATVLSLFLGTLLYIRPRTEFLLPAETADQVRVVLFLLVGGLISWLCESLHRRRRHIEAQLLEIQRVDEQFRQATQLRIENEERLRLMIEGVKDYAIFMLDTAGRIVTWNSGAERIIGYAAHEVVGRHYELYFPPEDTAAGKPQRELDQAAENGSLDEEGWRIRKDGSRFWSNGVLTALYDDAGKVRGFAKVTRDLTEWTQAEEALQASNERFRLLVEGVKDYAIFMLDAVGKVVTWNSGAQLLFGYTADEIVGQSYSRFFQPADVAGGEARKELDRAAAEVRLHVSGWRVRKDGSRFWSNGVLTALFDDQGRVRGFAKITKDLSEQHRLEERLEQLAAIVESSNDAIVRMNFRGIIESWNPAAERAYGYSAAEAVGRPYSMLIPLEQVGEYQQRLAELARGESREQFETMHVRKDGGSIEVSSRFSPILDAGGSVLGASAISRDISEQRKLEEQLNRSQRMEAFGQLAGGVAHDFNNLLTVITGFTELLIAQTPGGDPNHEFLDQIQQAGARATSLTRQLLAFSRRQVLEPKVLDLNSVIGETEKMLRRLIGEDIRLAVVPGANLRSVKVDPGQIEQVILNLAVNSRDAMPQGGMLTIETQNVDLDESYTKIHPEVAPGTFVLLSMSDTGCGITPEVKARLFEPFFTTKGVGKGTGLGLAVVQGIVKQSGGSIEVYSEAGAGTTFKLYLPAVPERPAGPSSPDGSQPAPGTETVLLVEDEDAVRAFAALALRTYGYEVLAANGGKEALEIAEAQDGKIDLLVTDVVMPQMSGGRLADTLWSRYPGLKILYVSGYTDDAVVRHGILQADVAFLQKPFTPVALARKVREVLDSK